MHPLVRKVGSFIAAEGLLAPGERCVLGVSGGPDSMALLHVLAELGKRSGWMLVAAHVDHGLRPGEAEAEADLVRGAAGRLGVLFTQARVDVRSWAEKRGLSIEHAARDLRYDFFEQVARQHGAGKIVVAHTADDQAEEVLLRLIRGSGRAGLAGMAPCRDNRIARPFLNIGKQEILAYLAETGTAFCEDSSNRQRIFLRNRIRLDLLPWLKKHFNPAIERSLRERAAIFRAEEELLATLARVACESVLQEETGPEPVLVLRLPEFARQPLALERRVLESACWRMGCRPTFRQIEQLRRLSGAGEGALLHLPSGLRVRRQGQELCFRYPQGKRAVRGNLVPGAGGADYLVEIGGPGEYPLGAVGLILRLEILATAPEQGPDQDPATVFLDVDSLSFPLLARPFRPGDRFCPLGAPGRKKVGDFFTDRKVPLEERRRVPVLADSLGIVALPGMRADQRCAVGPRTRRILVVTLTPVVHENPGENGFTENEIHGKKGHNQTEPVVGG